ncbi:MAG: ABC transporter ATP-binding protein, partial [Rhodoferax sp.]|nr:ABC transporter ATP-binding protein [Rhodoferax sp.]
ALILITHNMGVVHDMAQRVAVMYAGQVMEVQPASSLFLTPQHPYTEALLAAMPERSDGSSRLATIGGMVPGLRDRPTGCLFAPRCSLAEPRCTQTRPSLDPRPHGLSRCHLELAGRGAEPQPRERLA